MTLFTEGLAREQIVANFEELIAENQIQNATDLLITADPEDQTLVITATQPALLERFVEALDQEDKLEVTEQLAPEAYQHLLRIMARGASAGPVEELVEQAPHELAVAEEVAEESPWRMDFAIVDGRLRRTTPAAAAVTVYSDPTSAVQRDLLDSIGIDEHMLESALDPDEISRLEFDEEERQVFIVMKRPHREENGHPETLSIISVGALLQHNRLVIVTTDDAARLVEEGDRAETPRRLLLRLMASTVNEFLLELKMVKRTSREIQARLAKSFENREFLRMFSLSEGLVYHINAIDANGRVLRKLRHLAARLDFDDADLELLDDIVIDNDQCSHQAQIFSTVLGGLLDARGNIINNNMNILIKNLTIVNTVFLPLSLIAGMGGMSEFSMILTNYGIDWRLGYAAFCLAMVLFGLASWFLVSRLISSMASR